MGYIQVDIDMSDIETDDMIEELGYRKLSPVQIKDLTEIVFDDYKPIEVAKLNLPDRMKLDFFMENFDKIKLEDLEKLV